MTPDELASFRREVAHFMATQLPADIRETIAAGRPLDRERQTLWQRKLWRRGWAAPGWPAEHGGCDWTVAQRHIFDEETVRADAPFVNPFGLMRAGPVILAFGTEAQKRRFLPGILDSSTWWCQGYSEPGAGSDLAALSLKARTEGDEYVLTGTKTWTTQAHLADWMFCLVRTGRGASPRDGITFLLVDMKTPGITVRPITTLDWRAHVNEVVFNEVRVPHDQRIGDEGQGWRCSAVVLGHERLQIAEVAQSQRLLARLVELVRTRHGADGQPLAQQPAWRLRIADAQAQWQAHALAHRHFVSEADAGIARPQVSMLKLRGAELRQHLNDLTLQVLALDALVYEPDASDTPHCGQVQEFLYSRASTIYGGSNEVQRNILARHVLGLS